MTTDQLFLIGLIGLVATPIMTLITTVIIQIFTWQASAEQRRRDLEDRKEVARQAKLAKAELYTAVVQVGKQATAAYKEANQSNLKIQAVQNVLTTALNLPQKPITETTGANTEVPKE